MAYCRFGPDSDVYVYESIYGGFDFFLANKTNLGEKDLSFTIPTIEEAIHRLERMKIQGYKVPDYAIESMKKDSKKGE